MNKPEYEQKKCWKEFITMSLHKAFNFAFDRAYALGKEKEDATTQQDYKSSELECWCDFCNTEIARKNSFDRTLVKAANNFAFFRGYRFGKQEKDAYAVIQGWVCRDKEWGKDIFPSDLFLAMEKPKRDGENGMWYDLGKYIPLNTELFPDLTWSDEPQEVEIIIKRKNSKQE